MWANLVAIGKTILAIFVLVLGTILTALSAVIAIIVSATVAAGLAIYGLFLFFKD